MSVYLKQKTGIYFVQFCKDGVTYIKSSGSRDKQVAIDLEKTMRQSLETPMPSEILFHSAMDQYLNYNRTSTSIKNYTAISNWIKNNSKNIPLVEVDSKFIEQLLDAKQDEDVSTGTMYQYRNFLLQVFKYHKIDMDIKQYTVKNNRLRYLSKDEEKLLLSTLQDQNLIDEHDLVIMLLDTGARLNEILSLDWSHIDMNNRTISLYRSKVDNESLLYMTDRIYEVLINRKQLFTNLSLYKLRKILNKLFADVSIHTLRHTLASKLLQNNIPLVEVKEILGHSSIQTTMRYSHLDKTATFKKAASVLNSI